MTTMIERVARAICEAAGENPGDIVRMTFTNGGPFSEQIATVVRCRWEEYKDVASAAIAAMREPTQTMLAAMDEHAGTIAPEYAYEAAIDAALNEKEPT